MSSYDIDMIFDRINELKINNRETTEKKEATENVMNDADILIDQLNKSGINYYAILGCTETASELEIKKAYQKKLKSCHPDKVKQTKETISRYKLIREAGEILKDSMKRRAYDMERKTGTVTGGYDDQVSSFKEYMKLQQTTNSENMIKIAKLRFDESQKNFLKKHHIQNDSDQPITEDEYGRRFDDMMLQREMEEADYTHDDIFRGKQFDRSSFNQIFEKKQIKQNNKETNRKSDRIIKYEDIQAFDMNADFGTSLDNYDKLYTDEIYSGSGNGFGGVGDNEEMNILGDLANSGSVSDNESNERKKNTGIIRSPDELDSAMRRMMAERNDDISNFGNMKDVEYGSTMDNPFSISNQLGFVIGNNMFGNQTNKKQNMDSSTLKAYKGLLENNNRKT